MRPRYTKEVAQKHLDAWLAAELALSTGQAYTIGRRSLTRANIKEVMQQIRYWQQQVDLASGKGRSRTRRIVPLDT
ncbi:DUF6148 family protein [Paenibacillus camelliae]|uniref:DUF6148 family protein n=1 Tax=Paenibacillus camelliae TaxID=512410 RepID=UPI0020406DC1|nr:DUF6148 family protein [Paenibacillus camelliae]MCM3632944.1 DUF6148 family protein [Paenibacillus camelliae]